MSQEGACPLITVNHLYIVAARVHNSRLKLHTLSGLHLLYLPDRQQLKSRTVNQNIIH